MPSHYPIDFPALPRIAQKNSFYCGPACLEMLAAYEGQIISQDQVVAAAGVQISIAKLGMTIEQLGVAAKKLCPSLHFFYMYGATLPMLAQIVHTHHTPVGVEWQGVFDYPDEEIAEDEDDDPGHLSIVTHLDTAKNVVRIADPDRHYAGKDRLFTVMQFELRWWDINEIYNPKTGKREQKEDTHPLFVLVPEHEWFPKQLGMIAV